MTRTYEYRRKLPHYQPDGKIFFITFCTHRRWRLPEFARTVVLEVCLHGHRRRFDLLAVVVMPDHVHLALTPFSDPDGTISIPEIMQAIKGTSAHQINHALGRRGKVWQDESFDRALRREEALDAKIAYMLDNPARAGLVHSPLEYRWLWWNTEGPERVTLARAGTARASTVLIPQNSQSLEFSPHGTMERQASSPVPRPGFMLPASGSRSYWFEPPYFRIEL